MRPDSDREEVRQRYAELATTATQGGTCCTPEEQTVFGAARYDADDLGALPEAAAAASIGCGNPTAVADLRQGDTVLDLGSGGGIDVILSARRVAPTGKAYGLDMTEEMLDLARGNAADASVDNVEFLQGHIEQIPLPDASVDVVISNCVINLSTDKPAVFAETSRVLRPGGRFAVSDVVADDDLTDATRASVDEWIGCVAGALTADQYRQLLSNAGLIDVEIIENHRVHEHAVASIIRARKPGRLSTTTATDPAAIGGSLVTQAVEQQLAMEILCAECGCLVERGSVITRCGRPDCCCAPLPDADVDAAADVAN